MSAYAEEKEFRETEREFETYEREEKTEEGDCLPSTQSSSRPSCGILGVLPDMKSGKDRCTPKSKNPLNHNKPRLL